MGSGRLAISASAARRLTKLYTSSASSITANPPSSICSDVSVRAPADPAVVQGSRGACTRRVLCCTLLAHLRRRRGGGPGGRLSQRPLTKVFEGAPGGVRTEDLTRVASHLRTVEGRKGHRKTTCGRSLNAEGVLQGTESRGRYLRPPTMFGDPIVLLCARFAVFDTAGGGSCARRAQPSGSFPGCPPLPPTRARPGPRLPRARPRGAGPAAAPSPRGMTRCPGPPL